MADIPSSFTKVNDIEVASDAPLTESLHFKYGGNDNFLFDELALQDARIDALEAAGNSLYLASQSLPSEAFVVANTWQTIATFSPVTITTAKTFIGFGAALSTFAKQNTGWFIRGQAALGGSGTLEYQARVLRNGSQISFATAIDSIGIGGGTLILNMDVSIADFVGPGTYTYAIQVLRAPSSISTSMTTDNLILYYG